jgi:EAL domain-containing protein (putative c-di-GMP-specific phosphodiesterase class I)
VVALSAYADQETVLSMLRVGATSYLVEGLDVDELYEAIRGAAAGMSVLAPGIASGLVSERSSTDRQEEGLTSDSGPDKARILHLVKTRAFIMFFQPIVDLIGGATAGFEALARFPLEPVRGPEAWFAAAHGVGLGIDLELACIRAALGRIEFLPPSCFLSLNLSPSTAASGRLPPVLEDEPADRLVLEVTEHAAVEDYVALNRALARLSVGGLRLAIDDVGAGFSSLRHLLSLHPDFIKIDRSLCRHVNSGPGRVLLEGLVSFSTEVGATVIAEGIETREELDGVRDAGVRFGQGYLLGVPAPMLRARGRRNARTFVQPIEAPTGGKRLLVR